MQDTLWCCQERIISKKVWRTINYEIQVMRHKESNQMNAYHLGEAMGKVTLGPGDCDPIMAEKAGHFLTRMVIEHSKTIHNEKQLSSRVDSECVWPTVSKVNPMSKSEAAHAKAKSYNRIINKIHYRNQDWIDIASVAVYALMEDEYEEEPAHYDEPYLSIFTEKLNPEDATLSPILYRLVSEASKPIEPVPKDPFENSLLFGKRPNTRVETQVSEAFDDFMPLLKYSTLFFEVMRQEHEGKSPSKSHLKLINSPFSNMKRNLKKTKSQGEGDYSDENEVGTFVNPDYDNGKYPQKPKQVKGMMKRVIKMGSIAPAKKFPTTTIH
ncbi:hypothetical protein K501DRAFT_299781 [Backusella circina FSU 941]|nr:hypothetical protein K501DRAFT_299781 [Backusella circina FSU 941]